MIGRLKKWLGARGLQNGETQTGLPALGSPEVPSKHFDKEFYLAQISEPLPPGVSAWRHYLDEGERLGMDPHPLFSTRHYASLRPDVLSANVSLLLHFDACGLAEGVIPVDLDRPGLRETARRILESDPASELAQTVGAAAAQKSGDYQEALAIVETIKRPGLTAHILKTQALYSLGRFSEALQYVSLIDGKIHDRNPTLMASLLGEIGHAASRNGDFVHAIEAYSRLAAIETSKDEVVKEVLRQLRIAHVNQVMRDEGWERGAAVDEEYVKSGALEKSVKASFVSVKAYCLEFGHFYLEHLSERPIAAPLLRFVGEQIVSTAERGDLVAPPQYLAAFDNVRSFARCNVVLQGDHAIYDLAAHPRSVNAVLGDYIHSRERSMVRARAGERVILEELADNVQSFEYGLMMFGVASGNYGHWFLEYLPRMLSFNSTGCPREVPIFVDEGMPVSHYESLALLNKDSRPIVELKQGATADFGRLYMAPVPAYFPLESRGAVYDTVWPTDVFSELRRQLLSAAPAGTQNAKRRILISRRSYAQRRLVNENDVERYLRAAGFETIYPEKLSFVEQIQVFQSAEIVVGSCSSALTNCIFCEAGTPVIGLIHSLSSFNFNGYASFLAAAEVDLYFLKGESLPLAPGQHPFHADYSVPVQQLQAVLDRLGFG